MNDQDICPLPSHPRTVRVDPHTGIAAWPLEPGDELIIQNNSGVKIEVEAGTLSHGRVERINELVKERDALRAEVETLRREVNDLLLSIHVLSCEMLVDEIDEQKFAAALQGVLEAVKSVRDLKRGGRDGESEAGE